MKPVFLGRIPTPALASYAFESGKGSMMITGSHIPFDRNGYKTNTAHGELLKRDEAPIQTLVERVRARFYAQPLAESLFNSSGMFRDGSCELTPAIPDAAEAYLNRYSSFFAGQTLRGMKLLVYQHSAVGRDLLAELLRRFGAEVITAGRSETFVPIDTEAIDEQQLKVIEALAIAAWKEHGKFDAVVSTDGDSDWPLILAVDPADGPGSDVPCRVRFFGGDLVGMIVADYLQADAVVVPISCNDAVDLGTLKNFVEPKTRIGSPYVIAGMQAARDKGRKIVCGWEANGGFLLGSTLTCAGLTLRELPTRDAFLPILAVLLRAKAENVTVAASFDALPKRFSRAAPLKNFPRAISQRILARFSPGNDFNKEIAFIGDRPELTSKDSNLNGATVFRLIGIRAELEFFFNAGLGFGRIIRLNYTDGIRIYFSNGDVAHVRPSGNADELRIYAVADLQTRADFITQMAVAEPDGILRKLELAVAQ
jgi:phosphomannomutase